MTLAVLFLAPVIGLIPAAVASRKGCNFIGWWLFGTALFVVALPVSLLVPELPRQRSLDALPQALERTRKCPYCAEQIREEAIVCRYCGRESASGREPLGIVEAPTAEEQARWDDFADPRSQDGQE